MPYGNVEGGEATSGLGTRYKVAIPFVTALIVTASIALVLTSDTEDEGEEREVYEVGDYESHYANFFIGMPNWGGNCYLNEELNLTFPPSPDRLPIYRHRPPRLEDREDGVEYLARFGLNVSSYAFDTFDDPKGLSFSLGRDGVYIGLVVDGRFTVSYNVPKKAGWHPNITKEEAVAIGLAYIENHSKVPEDGVMMVDTHAMGSNMWEGPMVTGFSIIFQRTIDGYQVYGSGSREIRVRVNAQYGRVESFDYHWTDLEPIEDIEQERIGDLDEIARDYIALHNERVSSFDNPPDWTANVTSVEIVYRNPFGASDFDIYEGCLFYVYLPYVILEWNDGDGMTTLSPLGRTET